MELDEAIQHYRDVQGRTLPLLVTHRPQVDLDDVQIDVVEIDTYLTPQADVTDGNDKAKILVCRVTS